MEFEDEVTRRYRPGIFHPMDLSRWEIDDVMLRHALTRRQYSAGQCHDSDVVRIGVRTVASPWLQLRNMRVQLGQIMGRSFKDKLGGKRSACHFLALDPSYHERLLWRFNLTRLTHPFEHQIRDRSVTGVINGVILKGRVIDEGTAL